jgi:hypothetical protein
MIFNHLKLDGAPYHDLRNVMPGWVCISRLRMLGTVLLLLTLLGAGDVVAGCINPIALWKLEESGANPGFQDEVNPGQHIGVCRKIDGVSVCPEAEPARYGMGQRFYVDSRLSGIDIPSDPIFNWDGTDSFSVSFWMKRDNTPLEDNEVIIGRNSKETGNRLHWWIGLRQTGVAEANFLDRSGSAQNSVEILKSDKLITDNRWHYIVFVRNTVTCENRLYVDGYLEDKRYVYYENTFSADATAVNIGWLDLNDVYQYKGVVDEVALYDIALPPWFIHDRYYADERYTASQTDPCD